ncbi:hypothetical protein F4781DRAFT_429507 [Annulohypoxylon bovei var. microspora]|nr:hypothetical protein F4781DRAFT_429507 [Annulohypoxylon bovei var. microspora]
MDYVEIKKMILTSDLPIFFLFFTYFAFLSLSDYLELGPLCQYSPPALVAFAYLFMVRPALGYGVLSFASLAATLLLDLSREIHIPARWVIGYLITQAVVGSFTPFGWYVFWGAICLVRWLVHGPWILLWTVGDFIWTTYTKWMVEFWLGAKGSEISFGCFSDFFRYQLDEAKKLEWQVSPDGINREIASFCIRIARLTVHATRFLRLACSPIVHFMERAHADAGRYLADREKRLALERWERQTAHFEANTVVTPVEYPEPLPTWADPDDPAYLAASDAACERYVAEATARLEGRRYAYPTRQHVRHISYSQRYDQPAYVAPVMVSQPSRVRNVTPDRSYLNKPTLDQKIIPTYPEHVRDYVLGRRLTPNYEPATGPQHIYQAPEAQLVSGCVPVVQQQVAAPQQVPQRQYIAPEPTLVPGYAPVSQQVAAPQSGLQMFGQGLQNLNYQIPAIQKPEHDIVPSCESTNMLASYADDGAEDLEMVLYEEPASSALKTDLDTYGFLETDVEMVPYEELDSYSSDSEMDDSGSELPVTVFQPTDLQWEDAGPMDQSEPMQMDGEREAQQVEGGGEDGKAKEGLYSGTPAKGTGVAQLSLGTSYSQPGSTKRPPPALHITWPKEATNKKTGSASLGPQPYQSSATHLASTTQGPAPAVASSSSSKSTTAVLPSQSAWPSLGSRLMSSNSSEAPAASPQSQDKGKGKLPAALSEETVNDEFGSDDEYEDRISIYMAMNNYCDEETARVAVDDQIARGVGRR